MLLISPQNPYTETSDSQNALRQGSSAMVSSKCWVLEDAVPVAEMDLYTDFLFKKNNTCFSTLIAVILKLVSPNYSAKYYL